MTVSPNADMLNASLVYTATAMRALDAYIRHCLPALARKLNTDQALILYNIGDQQLGPSDLRKKGYYAGTNASYNLKGLRDGRFITQTKDKLDKRREIIALSPTGKQVAEAVDKFFTLANPAFTSATIIEDTRRLAGLYDALSLRF